MEENTARLYIKTISDIISRRDIIIDVAALTAVNILM